MSTENKSCLHFSIDGGKELELYVRKVEHETYLLYAPLSAAICIASESDMTRLITLADSHSHDSLIASLADDAVDVCQASSPANISELTILLNQKCNFSCSYCYSAKGRSSQVLDEESIRAIIDYFVVRSRGDQLRIVFSGGGDPVLSFGEFRCAVEYAMRKASEEGVMLSVGMVTNGSSLTDEYMTFIRDNQIELVVSCDILEDVHNRQRSHYDIVAKTIDRLCDAGIAIGIRSTITPLNVRRMSEMVEVLHERFPEIRSAAFEAVLSKDLFPEVSDLKCFYDDFIEHIFEAQRTGRRYGISIGNTIINNVRAVKSRPCLGKLVVTPFGDLMACSRIASEKESFFHDFVYGKIRNGMPEIDAKKYKALMNHNVYSEPECADCVAKWHCGGGCLLARLSYPKAYMETYCEFIREMTWRTIADNYLTAQDWLKQNNIYCYHKRDFDSSHSCDDEDCVVLYSPIARRYVVMDEAKYNDFLVNGSYKEELAPLADYVPLDKQRKVRRPEDYTLLTVLPNNVCNFNCSYCYSAKARNGSRLSIEALTVAIDYFIDSKPDGFDRALTISFMGGGEPMLSWDCIREGVIHARRKVSDRDINLNIRIITNGSIIDSDILDFLKNQHIDVSVSFEIIQEVQDMQRKHYDMVYQNINSLLDHGIAVQINSTITPANVERMEEMIHLLHTHFPSVKNAMFEPVVSQEMFATPQDMRIFYEKYVEHFCESLSLADRYGIALTSFAYLRTIFPLERSCPGELCVTADADITGCYCVASPQDALFGETKYGTISDGKIDFDMDSFHKLLSKNVYSRAECKECKVKWNCGGGCFHQYATYSQPYKEEVCRFTKSFFEHILWYKVKKGM